MDLVESIRRELGFIHVEGQPAVEAALKELRGNLARALNRYVHTGSSDFAIEVHIY